MGSRTPNCQKVAPSFWVSTLGCIRSSGVASVFRIPPQSKFNGCGMRAVIGVINMASVAANSRHFTDCHAEWKKSPRGAGVALVVEQPETHCDGGRNRQVRPA